MTIQEVMLRIEIPEEVRENIGKYSLSEKEFYEWKHVFENDFEIFLNKCREAQKHFLISRFGVKNVIGNTKYMDWKK